MLSQLHLEFEYILDGDMTDLTLERLDRYFTGKMHVVSPATSCGMKHFLAYERIVTDCPNGALILEDDMFLNKKFPDLLLRSILQTHEFSGDRPVWVGYEATGLKLIPRSRREKGVNIYPANELQCTGAYYINQVCAQMLVDQTLTRKCHTAFDWYVTWLHGEVDFDLYWAHPVLAEQGTHTGRMQSAIGNAVSNGSSKTQLWVRIKRPLTFRYKQLISFFR